MGRAIVVAAVIVLLSYCFVLLQLATSRPRAARPESGPAPVLEARRDGSVYAVNLEIERLERRLAREEERSGKLATDLAAIREERVEMEKQVLELENDLRRLRRQVNERPAERQPAPANGPAVSGPPEAVPVPVPSPGPGD